MQIILSDSGKRYNRDWIFKGLNFTFSSNHTYAITGNNGSGKSTLLQSIAGIVQLNRGKLSWNFPGGEKEIAREEVYKYFSIVAPYMELIEEMTATEFLKFHSSFKAFISGISIQEILNAVELPFSAHNKQIRNFSSGMKQRVKLAQAIFSDTPVLLLDEPCTNLDRKGFDLYHCLIEKYCKEKLLIISSNDEGEYGFSNDTINIEHYKS